MEAEHGAAAEADLPPYEGAADADVVLVVTPHDAASALRDLEAQDAVGFDTESKPTFVKGEVSTGPHLIQLAAERRVYLFPVAALADAGAEGVKALLESPRILKVGFGLGGDLELLAARLGIAARNVLDLARALPGGARRALGAKTAAAIYLGCTLQKSRRMSTSNWASPRLSARQRRYAADDAQVALRVYRAACQRGDIPAQASRRDEPGDVDEAARRRLIERHTPLVRQIAHGMARGLPASVHTDDLIQDGLVGLVEAVIRSSRETAGRQFEAYVAQRVRGAMLDGLRAGDGATRRVRREMRRVEAALRRLGQQHGRAPREGEVAAALDMPLADYQRLLQEADDYRLLSLDDLEADGGNIDRCARNNEDPLAVLQRAAFRAALRAALEALPEQEQGVMADYYEAGRTMREIGERLGLSQGRVSQIHAQAIARLRGDVLPDAPVIPLLAPRRAPRPPL